MVSTSVGSHAIVLEVLNQHNYTDWRSQVETYLLAKDLWDVVEQRPPLVKARNKAWKRKDARALHAIKISCGTEMFSFIRECKTANSAWNAFKNNEFKTHELEKKVPDSPDLHRVVTAAMKGELHTVSNLLSSMIGPRAEPENQIPPDLNSWIRYIGVDKLKIKDGKKRTALDIVIVASSAKTQALSIQIARAMVEKNPEILTISSMPWNYIPVVRACSRNKWEMARYLFSLTPPEALHGRQGAQLISMCIRRPEGLDVAWNAIQKYPKLAMTDNAFGQNSQKPMIELAGISSAYPSRARLTLWQKLIYKGIRVQPIEFPSDYHIIVPELEEEPSPDKRSVMSLFRRAITGASKLFGISHVYEMKLNHLRFDKFLSCMAEKVMKDLDELTPDELQVVRTSLFKAIAQGHVEFVMHMSEADPAVMNISDNKKKSIYQYAIECRQEKIYNLIYQREPEERDGITHNVAKFNTNMLHSAANLPSVKHWHHIQGVSLQMQRELQWFKEVESILPREMHEYVNISNVTARELFTINHKKLKDEAQISTKGVATACTTVGALIVTIMFAAAFTFPGGTNSDTGAPMFLHKTLFRVFILSDTISLISSATSVITFLGLLTSTYAEDDFLWSLPTKMMIGLSTLFISIVTMMITFSCALTIMFHGEAKMIITCIVLAAVPVVSFAFFLFPLLFEICVATYGPSMFPNKNAGGRSMFCGKASRP